MDLFDLVAKITLDSSEAEKGIETFGGKLKGGFGTAAKVAGTAITAVTAATTAMAGAMARGVSNVAEYGDNIDKMSQKMGMSAEAYQEWDAIMQHSGTSIESMQAGMKTLANAVESGNAAFERLGMSQEEIANMSQEELFSATITALQNVENETERTYLAGQLLGRGATELGALLNTSAEDTEAMRQRVHELGGVMSDEAVKAAAAYQDSLQDMQTAFSGLSRGLMTEFLPGVTTVMDGLAEIFTGDSDSGIKMVSDGIDMVLDNITDKLPEFIDFAFGIIDALVDTLIDNLPKLLEMGATLLAKLIAGLISHIPQLIKAIPQIIAAIIRGFVNAWPQLKQAGVDLINMVGNGIKSLASEAWTWGTDLISNFIDGIWAKAQSLWDTVSGIGQGIRDFIGFSEPKEGPLSNFHTYAPDMMALFAKGIKDNEHLVTDQLAKSFSFESTITPNVQKSATAFGGADSDSDGVINIVVQSVLDGRVIGETAYKYQRGMARAIG